MASILIIEDDPFLSKAYQTLLLKEGFEVEAAGNGMEGLETAQKNEPDIILLDMLMPELGGMEFLKVYNQPEKHPNTTIIVFSNMSTPDSIEEARNHGASRYLTKATLSPKEMVGVIREVLAEKSSDAQII